jgi:hypothetical protein
MFVNHIDGDAQNNSLNNLEFKDHSGMSRLPDAGINGNAVKVDQLDLAGKHIKTHDSIAAASRSLDLASDDGGYMCPSESTNGKMSMASRGTCGDV